MCYCLDTVSETVVPKPSTRMHPSLLVTKTGAPRAVVEGNASVRVEMKSVDFPSVVLMELVETEWSETVDFDTYLRAFDHR